MSKPRVACPMCGAQGFVSGTVRSTGIVHFRPAAARFFTLHTADVPVQANMCAGCGFISLSGDPEKLELVLDRLEAESKPRPLQTGIA